MMREAKFGKCNGSRSDSKLTACDVWTYNLEAGDVDD